MLASRQFVNCWHEGAAAPQGCQSPWQAGRTVPAHRAVLLCSGVTVPVPSRGDLHAVHTAYVSTSLRSTAVLPMGKGNLPCSFTQTASAPGSGWHKQERGSPFLHVLSSTFTQRRDPGPPSGRTGQARLPQPLLAGGVPGPFSASAALHCLLQSAPVSPRF